MAPQMAFHHNNVFADSASVSVCPWVTTYSEKRVAINEYPLATASLPVTSP